MGGRKSKAQRTVMDSHTHIQQEQTKGGPPQIWAEKRALKKKPGRAMMGGFLWRDIWIQLFNV